MTTPSLPANDCTAIIVRERCEALGFSLAPGVSQLLARYLFMLAKWNRVMNLVGPSSWEGVLEELVADSFYLAAFLGDLELPPSPVCWDLGAGAGLPGLPLRMVWKEGDYTLVEAREKRALFLRSFLASCPLEGVRVYHGRAETFMRTATADLVVSRAFMPWRDLLELVSPGVKPKGCCVILAKTPLPATLPDGWTAATEKQYALSGAERYFWALRKS